MKPSMRSSVVMAVALAGVMAAPVAVAADRETFTLEVLPGKEVLVHDRAYFDNKTCEFTGYPEFVVRVAPRKGRITIARVTFEIPGGVCKGRLGRGLALRYTAAPNATGHDTFTFFRTFKGTVELEGTVEIDIY